MAPPPGDRLLRLSARACGALLRLYPPGFRRDYGPQVAQLFRDLCRDAQRRAGTWGLLGLWLRAGPDLLASALLEWRDSMHAKVSTRTLTGGLLLVPALLFILVNVARYELGIGLEPLYRAYDRLYGGLAARGLSGALDALVILSPAVVVALQALPWLRAIRLRAEGETLAIVFPRKVAPLSLAIGLAGLLALAAFAGYFVLENWECILGLKASC